MNLSVGERLDAYTDRSDECWIWTRALRNGYGAIWIDGRVEYAHRAAYELHIGSIPDGLELDHLCRVRSCCNPTHLEPVTRRENLMRGDTIVRAHHEGRDCGSVGCLNCRRFAA